MIVAGLDIGSKYIKLVFINQKKEVFGKKQALTRYEQNDIVKNMVAELSKELKIDIDNVFRIAATGAGRNAMSFINDVFSEAMASAKALNYLYPDVKTIIDVGAEGSKAIKIDKNGKIIDIVTNEKCAAGSGIFIESMARALEMSLEDFGEKSLESEKKIPLNAQCSVFAESDVISLIHSGVGREDIARAVNEAIANRVASMARRVRVEPEVALIGGVAKNVGFVFSLKNNLQLDNLIIPHMPEFINAYGAALLELEKCHLGEPSC